MHAQVLLVEDNLDDQLLAKRAKKMHSKQDYKLHIIDDGAQALEWLFNPEHTSESLPQLIVLDLNLPKINGLKVLQRLREHAATQYIPVVILTTSDETCDIRDSYAYGANSFIKKPIDFDEFIHVWSTLDQYWLHANVAHVA
ncbi:MAG: response regulator [Mariprofundaceae bacterium]|nr:response regulator [Mariprofundaceae bacterium]